MKINQKCNGTVNPKTGKKYSLDFKKRTVQYYLLGMYDEEEIWKKFQINRTLLEKWRKWYYEYFESPNYAEPNYGKGKIPAGRTATVESPIKGGSKRAKKRKNEDPWAGIINSNSRSRPSVESKKKWTQSLKELKKDYPQSSMEDLCAVFGKSRQAYYKAEQKRQDKEFIADLIIEEVKRLRKYQPRSGGRKLFYLVQPFFKKEGIKMGRDKFFDLLRERNLLIKKKKRTAKTTNSNHHFRKHPNLIVDLKVEKPNQLWVSDITYVRFGRTFFYLSLIMDAYSRKIVGWHLAEDLKADGTIAALKMAIATLPRGFVGLIHHSDRGTQYCCHAYVKLLKKNKIQISMTQNGDPYENILAERINRTIKEEFLDQWMFLNFKEAKSATAKAVRYYNGLRPHASLDYLTPMQAHKSSGKLKKRWKNPDRNNQQKRA